ncbi:MAG: long-chain fatty acid--CoA ligase [Gemmatimonadaceae bacterium]|nr:long-chain fatty acid--CoA ligase [Gemmatimonadaceae bacterium]
MLDSTMMDYQLTIPSILERARRMYPGQEIVSVMPAGVDPETKAPIPAVHRTTFGETYPRVMQLCNALVAAGVAPGDRVATMALNTFRHYELYFGVPSVGAVCHMVNIRLPLEQIAYILNHAEDRILFIENVFAGMIPLIRQHAPMVATIVVLGPVPGGLPPGTIDYEAFLATQPATFTYPHIDERQASGMCYTSGTTGEPKGVLYSHRAITLHSLASLSADLLGVNSRQCIMPIVPMFHVNGWGYPYTCAMTGAKQVFMSVFTDAKSIARVVAAESVTVVAGVPTIFLGLLDEMDRAKAAGTPHHLPSLTTLVIGGSSTPRALIAGFGDRHGVHVTPAWGMTETTPLGTANPVRAGDMPDDVERKYDRMVYSGKMSPLVELKLVDDAGSELPWGTGEPGRLLIRGPWITGSYYHNPAATAATQVDGWFDTGDIATIDLDGLMMIQDRAKDLIKSGGEWISSVDLENQLMGHPAVREAAVIAVPHPTWDERPLGVIVLRDPAVVPTKAQLDQHLLERAVAKWQLPDAYEFVDEIPKTTVGKFLKRALRERFRDYVLPAG